MDFQEINKTLRAGTTKWVKKFTLLSYCNLMLLLKFYGKEFKKDPNKVEDPMITNNPLWKECKHITTQLCLQLIISKNKIKL